MNSVNDITTGLRVPSQVPLDVKLYSTGETSLANLGISNNLAYTYYKGMIVYCVQEQTRWEWRTPNFEGEAGGLLPTSFIYPDNTIIFEVNYSLRKFNFFPVTAFSPTPTGTKLLQGLEMSFDWKKGSISVENNLPSNLPEGVTDNVYNRNGFMGYGIPFVEDGQVVHPLFKKDIEGTITFQEEILIEAYIHNLGVKIKDFSTVANYNPTIVISKYTPSLVKGTQTPVSGFNEVVWRKGSYKFSADNNMVRLTKIPIKAEYQVIDFGQEHYFRTTSKVQKNLKLIGGEIILCTRGAKYRYSQLTKLQHYSQASVYLQFHIEITMNGKTYLSDSLGKLKMIASVELPTGTTYDKEPGQIFLKDEAGSLIRRTKIYFKHV